MEDPLELDEAQTEAADAPTASWPKAESGPGDTQRARPEAAGDDQEQAVDQPPGGEVTVNWNGTPKRMSLSELTKLAQAADSAKQEAEAARKLLGENEQLRAIQEAVAGMESEDQERFVAFLQNPAAFRPQQQNGARNHGDREQAVDGDDRIERMERLVMHLAQLEQQRAQATQADQRDQEIDRAMARYPVFGEDSTAARYARNAILNELMLQPESKVDDIAAKHASTLHQLLQQQRQAVAVQGRLASEMLPPAGVFPPQPSSRPSTSPGRDLESGRLRQLLLQKYAGRTGAR